MGGVTRDRNTKERERERERERGGDLLVAGAHGHGFPGGQFDALEEGCLGGVAVDFTFQDRDRFLAGFEFSPAAQSCHARQSLPAAARLVVLRSC